MKRTAFLLGMALALPLAANEPAAATVAPAPPRQLTLAQAFELAWQRTPAAQALTGRQGQSRAEADLAAAWTPAAPKVTLGALSDRFNNNSAGWQEWEAELAVPLWLPGQRDAQQALAQAQQSLVGSQAAAQRLELAGTVRDAWWRLATAANAGVLAQGRLDWAKALQADVDRRWRAGEMARTDANIARTEVQAAEAEAIETIRGERQAQFAWRTLTGVPPPAALDEEAPAAASAEPGANPRLLALDAAIQRVRARARLQDKSAREAPELTLRVLREHGSAAEPYANAIGVKLSIPFSSGPRLASEGAGIAAELVEAEAQAQQLREQLRFEVDAARADVQAAERRLALAGTRAELAAETLQLLQRAFTLGEADLATLLRARAAAFDAQSERERQRIARGAAISQLNQALGVLP